MSYFFWLTRNLIQSPQRDCNCAFRKSRLQQDVKKMFTWSLCLCALRKPALTRCTETVQPVTWSLCLYVFVYLCIEKTGSDKMYRSVHCQIATAAAEQIVVSRNDIRWFSFAFVLFVWKLDLWDKMSILSFSLDGWNYLQRMLCEISEAGGSLFITWLGMSVLEVCLSFSSPIDLKSFTTDSVELKKLLSFPHSDNFPLCHIHPGILLLLLGGPGDIPEKLNMFSVSSLFLF